jgi:tRNA/tmRNA/rRNA uracil-C5-methylase (TrmA/RlmC/RlmD family)
MIAPGTVLTLDVQKAAAGGRMLARHEGQIVLVWGAIPGERVRARVERAGKGVLYADTIDVVQASPDRREAGADWRCGGNVFAHVNYARQVTLKGEIIQDAFGRIAHVPLASPPDVVASPEHGYRMRARLHVRDGRIGFYREGSHELCDATITGQFLPETNEWIRRAQELLRDERGIAGLELAENVAADQRAHLLDLQAGADAERIAAIDEQLGTEEYVTDRLHVTDAASVTLRRHVDAFFQGNRFLIEPLVRRLVSLVPSGPVVDLYAGVGLFGLALAAAGAPRVTLVEGDQVSAADLQHNAEPYRDHVRIERRSVEHFLSSYTPPKDATFVVDPPRTGMSKDAVAGIIRKRPARIVYVSCDVATLARDTRTLLDAGYELEELTGVDLFPNTAHVETIATFHTP